MTKAEIFATKFKIQLNRAFPSGKTKFFTSAIITAAGSGTRLGGVSKQLLPLVGKPCIFYSLSAFQECPEINEIIITAKSDEVEEMKRLCAEFGIRKCKKVVAGGRTRQASVQNGFEAIDPRSDFVMIHDAARPLITSEQISLLYKQARRWGSACAAEKVSDSVKRSKDGNLISETVDRSDLFTVQTPQVFRTDIYRVSLAYAHDNKLSVTDDTALAERIGFPVKLCELDACNIKLTTKKDLEMICSIIKSRGEL